MKRFDERRGSQELHPLKMITISRHWVHAAGFTRFHTVNMGLSESLGERTPKSMGFIVIFLIGMAITGGVLSIFRCSRAPMRCWGSAQRLGKGNRLARMKWNPWPKPRPCLRRNWILWNGPTKNDPGMWKNSESILVQNSESYIETWIHIQD